MKPGLRNVLLVSVLALAMPLSAQQTPGSQPAPERAELERRLRQGIERAVRERLGMTEAEARELSDAIIEFQDERAALLQRLTALRERFARATPTGRAGGGYLTDDQAMEALSELRAIRNAEADLFNREYARLLELLTPAQAVSYYILREQLAAALRRARQSPSGGR